MSQAEKSSRESQYTSKSKVKSDISSVLAIKKAEAVAARTKADYSSKEAAIKKKQAQIAEQQTLMSAQATRLQTELEADLECIKTEGLAAEKAAEAKVLESFEAGTNIDNLSDIHLPSDNPHERTKRYVESLSNVNLDYTTANHTSDQDNDIQLTVGASLGKQTQPVNNTDATPTKTENIVIDSEVRFNLNPHARPYYPPDGDAVQVVKQIPTRTENQAVAHEITNFLLKKELLVTRLRNFDDQPETYISWKSGFVCVVNEIGVTDLEQLDLLVRWLGPASSKQAQSLKSSNANNPHRALRLIWERLDERYGAPEMIETALRNKLDRFPKLTNKDSKLLYELLDIISEIDSLKQTEQFKTVLSHFDSSTGVTPIVRKLTYGLQEKWMSRASEYKRKNNVPYPPFSCFFNFIHDMSRTLNDPSFAYDATVNTPNKKIETNKQASGKFNVYTKKTEISSQTKSDKETLTVCPLHNMKHALNDCRGFKRKHIQERKELLRQHGICFRCCDSNKHLAKNCDVVLLCKDCKSDRHATALHVGRYYAKDATATTGTAPDDGGEGKALHFSSKCTQLNGEHFNGKSCSKNILVTVYPKGQPQNCRQVYAILDEQSNISLARSEFFETFNEHGLTSPYTLSSCNGRSETYGRQAKDYVISSLDGSTHFNIPLLVECDQIPDMRDEIPSPDVALAHPHLSSIAPLIPPIDDNSKILLLIGRDIPDAHHVIKQLTGPCNSPYAQQLPLGWVIVGETCLGKVHRPNYTIKKTNLLKNGRPSNFIPCESEIKMQTKHEFMDTSNNHSRYDEIESNVFVTTRHDNKKGLSIEDRDFLEIMDNTLVKGEDGNWISPLPFRQPRQRLPNNRPQAYKRAKTLHHSLVSNPTKKEHFFEFMGKILDAGHAELAPPLEPGSECWYLPLFGVYHPQKPGQIRGVFDSSAKHEGLSLNDVMLKGPDLTNSLLGILLRFREGPVAVTADIERMFYCFRVREDHRDYLRFMWYKDNDFNNNLVEYRMTVHVFGNSPSPAIATYGLRKASENGAGGNQQDVIDFVAKNFYVDDALKSLTTAQEAIDLLKKTQHVLSDGGNIRLHKIASNSQEVMNAFPTSNHAKDLKDLDLGSDVIPPQRSLGLTWDVKTDIITFQLSSQQKPFTRRGVLSTIHSLFDPIGFVSPFVIRGKILMRELVAETTDWDEKLPTHYERQWEDWKAFMLSIQDLQIPRQYDCITNSTTKDILIYSDASEKAIAAVAYMQTYDEAGHSNVSFLLGKAKLAPLHGHTIPRLELCATVLAIEIGEIISDQLDVSLDSIQYFTDSKIVLGYLHNETRRFHVYVSNRVERVRRSSKAAQWCHVPTDINPADEATRDTPTTDITSSRWLNGPPTFPSIHSSTFPLCDPDVDKEIRQVTTLKTSTSVAHFGTHRFVRLSSWRRLIRTMARLRHISRSFRNSTTCNGWHICSQSQTVELLDNTEMWIIKQVQFEFFANEIHCIRQNKPLPKNSPIASLSPYIDEDGLLRVGGRLNKSTLSLHGRNPLGNPGKHHIATLLVRHHHDATKHQGRHFTEALCVRLAYGLPDVKGWSPHCVTAV